MSQKSYACKFPNFGLYEKLFQFFRPILQNFKNTVIALSMALALDFWEQLVYPKGGLPEMFTPVVQCTLFYNNACIYSQTELHSERNIHSLTAGRISHYQWLKCSVFLCLFFHFSFILLTWFSELANLVLGHIFIPVYHDQYDVLHNCL